MNSNLQASYQGLLNRNIGTSITCDTMNATTISSDILNVNSITASHYYGIICQTLNTSFVNPEITIGFDPSNNTITLQLFDSAIPLSRLVVGSYDSLATPSTLVFRDSYNSTTMDTLIVSNVLSATANALSTVSRSNTLSITTTTLNQNYYLPLLDTMTAGYKMMYSDTNNGLMYNPAGNLMTVTNLEVSNGVNIPLGQTYKINYVSLTTDNIQETTVPTNKYYTTARCQVDARTAISVVSTGSEVNATYSGGVITIPAITSGSVALSKLSNGTSGQFIYCNTLGVPVYSAFSLNAIPYGTNNQFLQTTWALNYWISMTGDASLSAGSLTIGTNAITTSKVLNYNITPSKLALGR